MQSSNGLARRSAR